MNAIYRMQDGTAGVLPVRWQEGADFCTATLKKEEVPAGIAELDFLPELMTAEKGQAGYFVMPSHGQGTLQVFFREREDIHYESEGTMMPVLGMVKGADGVLAQVMTMPHDCRYEVGTANGRFYLFPRFYLDGDKPYDDIIIRYYFRPFRNYSEMAHIYRDYQLAHGCVPLAERIKSNPVLKKSSESISLRIRMGWKPAPSDIPHQTLENEPPMKVACTFRQAEAIIEKLAADGYNDAEICLVGWNIKGHDGRWPEAFPVDPDLGGEADMLHLIARARELGFNIGAHTNDIDHYQIANNWDENALARRKDGSLIAGHAAWSGGQPYVSCPKCIFEQYDRPMLDRLKKMGLSGLHYIDCLTVIPIQKCYDPRHPCNTTETVQEYRKIMKYAKETFGGFSCEGSYDFGAEFCDFFYYTCYNLVNKKPPEVADNVLPFWQLVYHGIIMANTGDETVTHPIRSKKAQLKQIEFGGRPCAYVNQRFAYMGDKWGDWRKNEDITTEDADATAHTVAVIEQMCDEYRTLLRDLQYTLMESHEPIAENVYRTTYADGTEITCDYNELSYTVFKDGASRKVVL